MHGGPSDRIVECSHFSRQHYGDRSAPRRRQMSWAPRPGEVDVMAKRAQGLLNVGFLSARMAVLRSCALGI
jgi:hypothetical protein